MRLSAGSAERGGARAHAAIPDQVSPAAKHGRSAASRLLDLVFPQNIYCLCCGDTMESSRVHGICDKCAEKINWLDHDPFRASLEDFAFDHVLSCCVYGFYPRKIMHDLKLHGKPYIARSIGPLMAEKALMEGGEYTALVPVPCTKSKKKKRGYNQSEYLARGIADRLGIPYVEALNAVKPHSTQTHKGALERWQNIQGNYALKNDASHLSGKHILLVDDVITTGSTLTVCASLLKSIPGATISLFTLAAARLE